MAVGQHQYKNDSNHREQTGEKHEDPWLFFFLSAFVFDFNALLFFHLNGSVVASVLPGGDRDVQYLSV